MPGSPRGPGRREFVRLLLFVLGSATMAASAPALPLPARPADAPGGAAIVARIAPLDLAAREAVLVAEVRRGNVPDFWRRFVAVTVGDAEILVSPDYLAVGSDDDYFLAPLTPASAQIVADDLGCVLPTRRMVAAIHRAAPLQLPPSPIPPSTAMTTVPVFAQHNAIVHGQREAARARHPLGALVAGHKKDVVLTPRLAAAPDRVAIYGWHRLDGTAIQPLYLGHASGWVDYSHGVRLVRRDLVLQGRPAMIDAVLADPAQCARLSDEGPITEARYPGRVGLPAGQPAR